MASLRNYRACWIDHEATKVVASPRRQRFGNDELLGDDLDEFLFGADRLSLRPVPRGLRELAADRCFYCGRDVGSAAAQIDHFVAWTRHIDNGLANLVFAHASCNNAKRAYPAAEPHVEHWVQRLLDPC
jgi:5-methylcytosine-specific restriction endonuclease McrA